MSDEQEQAPSVRLEVIYTPATGSMSASWPDNVMYCDYMLACARRMIDEAVARQNAIAAAQALANGPRIIPGANGLKPFPRLRRPQG